MITLPQATFMAAIGPPVYRPTAWEWLSENELFGKPPVPDDWVAPTICIGLSPDYSGMELRILGQSNETTFTIPEEWGRWEATTDTIVYSGMDYSAGGTNSFFDRQYPSQPWPRNSKERRVLRALGSEGLFKALCDYADEPDRPMDHDGWNAAFWSFVARPPVPRCNASCASAVCQQRSGSPSVFYHDRQAPRHWAPGHYPNRGACG